MEFFYVVKATQKSSKQDAVIWFTAKTEARALLQLDVELEDAGIETGRGKDYLKPHRTNFPVVDGLPEENTVDYTWCERFELEEDGLTWQLKAGAAQVDQPADTIETDTGSGLATTLETTPPPADSTATDAQHSATEMQERAFTHASIPFEKRVIGTWLFGLFDELTPEQSAEASNVELDMDAHYAQNVMLASRNVTQLKHVFPETLADLFAAAKSVWPADGKAPLLSNVIAFFSEWIDTHTNDKLSRDDVTAKWQKKYGSSIVRTDSGTNAGGGNKTDRNLDYVHTLDTLDVEIAAATLPMDFDIYEMPGAIHRRAQEIVKKKESPFKEWSAALRSTPGILSFSRAAIFAVVRSATEKTPYFPGQLQAFINTYLNEIHHDKPTDTVLSAARQVDSAAVVAAVIQGTEPVESLDKLDTPFADIGKLAAEAARKYETVPDAEMIGKQLAAERGEFVPGISDPTDPKWIHEDLSQPKQPVVASMGGGMFSIESLMGSTTTTQEAADHEQMETTVQVEDETDSAVSAGESVDETGQQTAALSPAEVIAAAAPTLAAASAPEGTAAPEEDAAPMYPEFFEPGRYEGVPNEVYHAANGISSTMVKDARVSLMYYHGRHVTKVIPRQDSQAFIFGRATHSFVLEPEQFSDEYAVPAEMPKSVVSTSGDMVAIIKEYNASLPALMTPDELKAWIDDYNNKLTPPLSVSGDAEETGLLYTSLPDEFRRLPEDEKHTVTKMKACIKEYNASLDPMLKTSGARDQLLDQIATVAPEFAEQERAKFIPYNISGTKEQLTEIVRTIRPDVVTADDWHKQHEKANQGKTTISLDMYQLVKNINDALQADADASWLLNHPNRKSEVSYFGFDEDTGLEIRVRPDIEIRPLSSQNSICADLKTVSLGYVPQDRLKARLHREIIERGYHISAAMYCDTAELDTFAWIFVNKDQGYHWVAVAWAPVEMLELGRLEYRRLLQQINEATFTDNWPAPITGKYVDELNDYDINRLSELSEMKVEDLA